MKKTDFMPRCAPFDTYLRDTGLIGIEIGVDVGAHAHSMLLNADIAKLILVDIWDNPYMKGYCEGRLASNGFINKIIYLHCNSMRAFNKIEHLLINFDFMYFDQLHDYSSVSNDLNTWWPLLKSGGILGYRNYVSSNTELVKAVDEFVEKKKDEIKETIIEVGDFIIIKK